jgi:triacylglycerol lipase
MLLWPLLRGWAVSVPDHAGPDSNYGAGRLGGQVTLDGVRAAEHFAPAELGPDTPVGLWGYSGGGFSTAWAAELQPSYAPELNVVGSAEGGVPADFNDLINTNKGSGAFGLVFAAAVGLSREYPAMGLSSLLNPRGLQLQNQISTLCVGRLLTVAPGLSFNDLT